GNGEVANVARELGATCVFSGFVPPPVVADLLARWIELARRGVERAGWSRTAFPETETDPWGWLADYLGEPIDLTSSGETGRDAHPTGFKISPLQRGRPLCPPGSVNQSRGGEPATNQESRQEASNGPDKG